MNNFEYWLLTHWHQTLGVKITGLYNTNYDCIVLYNKPAHAVCSEDGSVISSSPPIMESVPVPCDWLNTDLNTWQTYNCSVKITIFICCSQQYFSSLVIIILPMFNFNPDCGLSYWIYEYQLLPQPNDITM